MDDFGVCALITYGLTASEKFHYSSDIVFVSHMASDVVLCLTNNHTVDI